MSNDKEVFKRLEKEQFKRTFTTCSGCGCSNPTYEGWADITVLISDGKGAKYVPIGKYCPRCKDRTWAYTGHGTDNPDWLFTSYELGIAMGQVVLRTHPYVFDNPTVVEILQRELEVFLASKGVGK